MSDHDYLKWHALLYKVAKKFIGINSLYDIDDLIQIGSIGLAKGLKTYENKSDIPLKNWLANNVSWTIYREINKNRSIDTAMSLYMPLGDDEDSTLEEIIGDDNVDVEAEIENKLMVQVYQNEIEKYLDKDKSNICILRWFEDMSYEYIRKVTGINNISGVLRDSRVHLVSRSKLFKEEYRRIRHIDEYSNPAAII